MKNRHKRIFDRILSIILVIFMCVPSTNVMVSAAQDGSGAGDFIQIGNVQDEKSDDPADPDNQMEDGLHQDEDGTWYYYLDGEIATEYTGLVEYYGSWYYVENGILNWNYTGLTYYYGTWYYVEGGVLNWGYTGLTEYYGSWYYVENGVLNWGYTGLTCYYGTWYYVEGGVLNWGYTGLTCYYDTWYYVEGGVLNWGYTGLTCYYDTWYYVEGGILNWNYTGLTCYYGSWYYVENGVLNWNYEGIVLYAEKLWYVKGGVLDFSYTGSYTSDGYLYKIVDGRVVEIEVNYLSEEAVYNAMISLKDEYPEGMRWTNDDFYRWNGGIYYGGYGCAAFAFILSDAAFGELPARIHYEMSNIRVGDILRINNDTHSVVVLEINSDGIVIAEGNYNSSIHWGRKISFKKLESSLDYVMTRYPK